MCKWLWPLCRGRGAVGSGARQGRGALAAPQRRVLQLDAAEAEPILDEREGVDEYNEMPMPV